MHVRDVGERSVRIKERAVLADEILSQLVSMCGL